MTNTTDPKKFQPAKLFHAVVLAGVALVSSSGAPNAAATSDAEAMSKTEAAAAIPGTCPPGSERPFPPCYWIK